MTDTPQEPPASYPHRPRLHVMELHESPILEGTNYERFSYQWILEMPSSSTSSSPSTSSPAAVVRSGDLIFVPSLLSGAGEFEAMRFVGDYAVSGEEEESYILLKGGVEYPEFPSTIVDSYPTPSQQLREAYAHLFDSILQRQHGGIDSLQDVMGGPKPLEEYWNEPPRLRETTTKTDGDPEEPIWIIPWRDCRHLETIESSL